MFFYIFDAVAKFSVLLCSTRLRWHLYALLHWSPTVRIYTSSLTATISDHLISIASRNLVVDVTQQGPSIAVLRLYCNRCAMFREIAIIFRAQCAAICRSTLPLDQRTVAGRIYNSSLDVAAATTNRPYPNTLKINLSKHVGYSNENQTKFC